MKLKIKLSELLVLMTLAMFSIAIGTVYATEQGAYATLVFGVGALNQVTVYQITTSKGAMTSAGLALTNIEFNSTTGTNLWTNASVAAGDTQNETYPIIYVDNTGTTNAALNISASDDIYDQDPCLKARYIYNQSESGTFLNENSDPTAAAGGSIGSILNDTVPEQIDSSFTPAEENWGVWLYGNFSDCLVGEDTVTFYINATFA